MTVGSSSPSAATSVDWGLVSADAAGTGLFMLGLLALIVGLPAVGVGLWAACVWLDWRALVRVHALARLAGTPAQRAQLARYLGFRAGAMGVAQALAVVVGVGLAAGGFLWWAVAVWAVASAGIACTRALLRLRPPG
jgi:hypothetical protein